MASLRWFVAGASAVGAGTLTSHFLLSDNTVSNAKHSSDTLSRILKFFEKYDIHTYVYYYVSRII